MDKKFFFWKKKKDDEDIVSEDDKITRIINIDTSLQEDNIIPETTDSGTENFEYFKDEEISPNLDDEKEDDDEDNKATVVMSMDQMQLSNEEIDSVDHIQEKTQENDLENLFENTIEEPVDEPIDEAIDEPLENQNQGPTSDPSEEQIEGLFEVATEDTAEEIIQSENSTEIILFDIDDNFFQNNIDKFPENLNYKIINDINSLNNNINKDSNLKILFLDYKSNPKACNSLSKQIKVRYQHLKVIFFVERPDPKKLEKHRNSEAGANGYADRNISTQEINDLINQLSNSMLLE